jgi:hypothetical protein
MSDCLLALERCSLIGLDDSPQLLRHSMLYSVSASQVESAAVVEQQLAVAWFAMTCMEHKMPYYMLSSMGFRSCACLPVCACRQMRPLPTALHHSS